MSGDRELFDVFDDLEAQAESEHHRERLPEIHDRSRSEYHSVLLESRLMASVRTHVEVRVHGVGHLAGTLTRVGDGWVQLRQGESETGGVRWTVLTSAVSSARGLSSRAVPRVAWSPIDAIGIGSPLRRAADERRRCVAHLLDGSTVEGELLRVGADFVEVVMPHGESVLVALSALAALRDEG